MGSAQVVPLPARASAADIEYLARLTESGAAWELGMPTVQDSDFASEARLLGWLARDSGRGVTLRLDERVRDGSQVERDLRHVMVGTLTGFIASRMTHRILDSGNEDLTSRVQRWQRDTLSNQKTIGSDVQNFCYLLDDRAGGLGAARLVDTRMSDFSRRLASELWSELKSIGLVHGLRDAPDSNLLLQTRRFLTETLENTERHATRDLDGRSIGGVRFLHVRRRFLHELVAQGQVAGRGSGDLSDYLRRLGELLGGQASTPVVEFTVADSGVGIPAHAKRTMKIYRGPLTRELDALRAAFDVPPPQDLSWEGFGLPKAQLAVRALGGFLMVRTGRVLATQHHLDEGWPSEIEPSLADARFHLNVDHGQDRPVLAGTAVTILVPWVTQRPERLF